MFDILRVAGLATLALGAAGASAQILGGGFVPKAVPAVASSVPPVEPMVEAVVPELADEAPPAVPAVFPAPAAKATLASLVSRHAAAETTDPEQRCLAIATYFESKGEPLAGQLAVARVILNRTRSGRFASTPCAVVRQPGQFSFVRGGRLPTPSTSAQWRTAVAIAHIAQNDLFTAPASNALFFHARRVSPDWNRKTRVAAVGNHIFYR